MIASSCCQHRGTGYVASPESGSPPALQARPPPSPRTARTAGMNPRSPEVVASSESVGGLPPALAHASFAPLVKLPRDAAPLIVPPDEHLRLVRLDAKSAGNLKGLRQMVAAWEAVAEKCDLAFEEMARLAVFRLEVERDLGAELAQTVRHGGDRSR